MEKQERKRKEEEVLWQLMFACSKLRADDHVKGARDDTHISVCIQEILHK